MKVLFVLGDRVAGVVATVGPRAQLGANGHLCCKTDNRDANTVLDETVDGIMYVAGVAGEQGAVNY